MYRPCVVIIRLAFEYLKKRYKKLEMLEMISNFYRIVSHIVYTIS